MILMQRIISNMFTDMKQLVELVENKLTKTNRQNIHKASSQSQVTENIAATIEGDWCLDSFSFIIKNFCLG